MSSIGRPANLAQVDCNGWLDATDYFRVGMAMLITDVGRFIGPSILLGNGRWSTAARSRVPPPYHYGLKGRNRCRKVRSSRLKAAYRTAGTTCTEIMTSSTSMTGSLQRRSVDTVPALERVQHQLRIRIPLLDRGPIPLARLLQIDRHRNGAVVIADGHLKRIHIARSRDCRS